MQTEPFTPLGVSPESRLTPPRIRPKSPMVFGVLSIVFAMLGLTAMLAVVLPSVVGAIAAADSGEFGDEEHARLGVVFVFLGLFFAYALTLLSAGIGLVSYRRWGRRLFCVGAVFSLGFLIFSFVTTLSGGGPLEQPDVARLIGGVIRQTFPILGLIYLFKPEVAASLKPNPETFGDA